MSKLNDPAQAAQVAAAEEKARQFVTELFQHVPVLDSGARGSTKTFVQRGIGDVLLAWENEAFLAVNELGPDKFEIVVPSISILAEPPVAVVDKWVDKHGTREVAEAYLEYLYSPDGQRLAAKHYYRPVKPEGCRPGRHEAVSRSRAVHASTTVFGGWQKAQKTHFDDGGMFDQIYTAGKVDADRQDRHILDRGDRRRSGECYANAAACCPASA